jgi:tetratricopeptide (TPR) repeat protein
LLIFLALGACSSDSNGGTTSGTNPKKASTLLNKALQEQVTGDVAQAKKDFEEVVRLDPQNKYGFYNLGLIEQNAGNDTAAENQYKLALAIDGKFEPALYNRAILRAKAGDTAGAIALYRAAIASNKKDPSPHFNLGLLLRQTGKTDEGNKEVQTAVKLDPSLRSKATAQGVPLPSP